jgi:NAD kinase
VAEFDTVIIVHKPTRLEDLLRRYTTKQQVKFVLESRGDSYDAYLREHETYMSSLRHTVQATPTALRIHQVDRDSVKTYTFAERDVIVTVGDAGLVVNVAKYAKRQPIISVNPDPRTYDPVLSTCTTDAYDKVLQGVVAQQYKAEELTMAEVTLNDGQQLLAINDLFIGKKTHVSARYEIAYNKAQEQQSSSGVIVSTGTGSTGWLNSWVTGAKAVAGDSWNGPKVPFPREASSLIFAIREPYPSPVTGTSIVWGVVDAYKPLEITSAMPEDGVIFSDGVESDYLEFNAGTKAVIKPAAAKARLVRY